VRKILGALLLILIPIAIYSYGSQLVGLDGTYWSRRVLASSSTGCVPDVTDSGTTCALFPAGVSKGQWYNVAITKAGTGTSTTVTLCYTLTATGANLAQGKISSDPLKGAGGAACHTLEAAGDRHDERPWATDIRTRPSGRSGICHGSVTSAGDVLYPPCSINAAFADGTSNSSDYRASAAECTAYGLSSTDARCEGADLWTQEQKDFVGAVLLVQAGTGSQPVFVRKARIQER
jgi:hypothetical protein